MLERIFNEINKYVQGIHKLNPGANIFSIKKLEQELNVRLPEVYISFLSKCNGGQLFATPVGITLYKVREDGEEIKKGKAYLNEVFKKEKRWPNMPNSFLIIAATCYGDLICMDLDTCYGMDAFVVKWDHEEGRVSQSWNGLEDWLMYELNNGKELINYDGSDVE